MDLDAYFSELCGRMGGRPELPNGSAEEVVAALEFGWHHTDPDHLMHKTNWALWFSSCPKVSDSVWQWILDKARHANPTEPSRLDVGIFGELAESSNLGTLKKLFSLLDDPELRWIFLGVYGLRWGDLYKDLARVEGYDPVTPPECDPC